MEDITIRRLTLSSSLGVGQWRSDGTIITANPTLVSLLGCRYETIERGKLRWQDVTPPEYAQLDEQAVEELRQHGECTPFEKGYIRADGTRIQVLVGGSAFGDGVRDAGAFFVVDLSRRQASGRPTPNSNVNLLSLSDRQRLIVLLAAHGVPQKRVASLLDIGLRTVELERHRAANKLSLSTPAATLWAAANKTALRRSLGQCPLVTDQIAAVIGFE